MEQKQFNDQITQGGVRELITKGVVDKVVNNAQGVGGQLREQKIQGVLL